MSAPGCDHMRLRAECLRRMKSCGNDGTVKEIQKSIASARRLTSKLLRLGVDVDSTSEEMARSDIESHKRDLAIRKIADAHEIISSIKSTREGEVIDWPALRVAENRLARGLAELREMFGVGS